jgi:hypothetical protein
MDLKPGSLLRKGMVNVMEDDMDFTNVQHGCLEEGTETRLGVIEAVSLTAYMIEGCWFPFHTIHGKRKPAQPLVTLTDYI